MQTFYNQAILSHNNVLRASNIVSGVINDVISATKTATKQSYTHGDEITYVISIINSGASSINNLSLSDNLGAYSFGTTTLVPLDLEDSSILYFIDGVLQPTPVIDTTEGLRFTGINLPANSNAQIVYTAGVNSFAPLGNGGNITNTVTVSGPGVLNNITASETVTTSAAADLAILKALSPTTIYNNGQLTYTLTIQNYGATAVEATENAIVSDTFNPILNNLSVSFNGAVWSSSDNYTYNEATGEFSTVAGNITVPAAVYSQDTVSGTWTVTPGVSVITITGNL